VGDYIDKGANMIAIITNDGWWDNSPGYKQHQQYAILRAIETRKFIARSANTGISCFIHPDGTVTQPTDWWVPAVIKENIIISAGETFYVRHGDYIAYAFKYIGYILLVYAFFGGLINRLRPGSRKMETDSQTGM
jgi:apolipoprotein N-acyltransferase